MEHASGGEVGAGVCPDPVRSAFAVTVTRCRRGACSHFAMFSVLRQLGIKLLFDWALHCLGTDVSLVSALPGPHQLLGAPEQPQCVSGVIYC